MLSSKMQVNAIFGDIQRRLFCYTFFSAGGWGWAAAAASTLAGFVARAFFPRHSFFFRNRCVLALSFLMDRRRSMYLFSETLRETHFVTAFTSVDVKLRLGAEGEHKYYSSNETFKEHALNGVTNGSMVASNKPIPSCVFPKILWLL